MPVVIGTDGYGEKDVFAVMDGFRGNADSWRDPLRDLRERGLEEPPEPGDGDGARGFRAALRDVFPKTREWWCRVHRTANVTGAPPRYLKERYRSDPHEIWMAETKKEADAAFDHFPAERCGHIRATNPTRSVFVTVRDRTRRTRGRLSRKTALSMAHYLIMPAKGNWRRLSAPNRLPEVIRVLHSARG